MRRREFLMVLVLGAAVTAAPPLLADPTDEVTRQLRAQGFQIREVTRTLLGRVRVVAENGRLEREIVFDRITGEIRRDLVTEKQPSERGPSSGGSGSSAGGNTNRGGGRDDSNVGNDRSGRGSGNSGNGGGGGNNGNNGNNGNSGGGNRGNSGNGGGGGNSGGGGGGNSWWRRRRRQQRQREGRAIVTVTEGAGAVEPT